RYLRLFPDVPLVRMAGVGRLKRNGNGLRLQYQWHDPLEWYVVMVRALVVPPAQVHADAGGRHVGQRMIEGLDLEFRVAEELRLFGIAETDVTTHGEVGRVDLQIEACSHDRFVLRTHRIGEGTDVFLMGRGE